MVISKQLTQQKFQEILVDAYIKGSQNQQINVIDMINEIKRRILEEDDKTVQ